MREYRTSSWNCVKHRLQRNRLHECVAKLTLFWRVAAAQTLFPRENRQIVRLRDARHENTNGTVFKKQVSNLFLHAQILGHLHVGYRPIQKDNNDKKCKFIQKPINIVYVLCNTVIPCAVNRKSKKKKKISTYLCFSDYTSLQMISFFKLTYASLIWFFIIILYNTFFRFF